MSGLKSTWNSPSSTAVQDDAEPRVIFLPLRPCPGDSAISRATPHQKEQKNPTERRGDTPPTNVTLSGFRGVGTGGGRLSIALLGFSITARQSATGQMHHKDEPRRGERGGGPARGRCCRCSCCGVEIKTKLATDESDREKPNSRTTST